MQVARIDPRAKMWRGDSKQRSNQRFQLCKRGSNVGTKSADQVEVAPFRIQIILRLLHWLYLKSQILSKGGTWCKKFEKHW